MFDLTRLVTFALQSRLSLTTVGEIEMKIEDYDYADFDRAYDLGGDYAAVLLSRGDTFEVFEVLRNIVMGGKFDGATAGILHHIAEIAVATVRATSI